MEKFYWVLEYIKVFLVYYFIMYVWPSVVFKKHLAKRTSRVYKFAFCTVVQAVVINTLILGLGLIKLLYAPIVCLIFYGLFFYFLLKDVKIKELYFKKAKHFVSGTYGIKSLFSDIRMFLKLKRQNAWKRFLAYMKGHWVEYTLLFIAVVFGMMYFSIGSLENHSFGFGDLYVHQSWSYYLTQGQIFSSGIYPEGLHCFIAAENMLFGIPIYNGYLFSGPVFTGTIIISMYIMFKTLFKWRYSPILAIALFLIVDVKNDLCGRSMSRFQWTMPQEFGFPAMFLCMAFVIRFFRNKNNIKRTKIPMFLKDDDLFIFTFSLAATIAIHFYATMMAFMLCITAAFMLVKFVFNRKFPQFLIACFAGVMIAFVPMIGAMCEGIRLNGSLNWAMSLFISEDKEETVPENENNASEVKDNEGNPSESISGQKADMESDSEATGFPVVLSASPLTGVPIATAAPSSGLIDTLNKKLDKCYYYGYLAQYGKDRTKMIMIVSAISVGLWVLLRLIFLVVGFVKKDCSIKGYMFDGYLMIVMSSVIFTIAFCMGTLGLPMILEQYRTCSTAQLMTLAIFVIPIDVIGTFIFDRMPKAVNNVLAALLVGGIYTGAKLTDNFHGYLFIELTRYNSAVDVTNSILNDMGYGNNNFTIVSSTDELYPLLGYGYHEELVEFINKSEYVSYTIPTKYIFIYVEKHPLARAQGHIFDGPSWLAENKYKNIFGSRVSVYPEVNQGVISEGMANVYFGAFPNSAMVYNTHWQRIVLNSKVYVWCQKFNAMYPNEMHTYYEDDDFVCYYLKQNPRNLYELATMDPSIMIPPEDYDEPIWPETYGKFMVQ